MKIFETDRLIVRQLREADSDDYFDMMSNPNVMNLIPRKTMSRKESDQHLRKHIDIASTPRVWGIEIINNGELAGICAFLRNNEQEDEIGYRFREKHWRKGFGAEIAQGLIRYGFEQLDMNKITADVDSRNSYSIKILEKFMTLKKNSSTK